MLPSFLWEMLPLVLVITLPVLAVFIQHLDKRGL